MLALHDLLAHVGLEIENPDEETFLLFSQPIPSQDLGFVDGTALIVDITVAGRELSITQSPALLSSNREQGTTGAVAWKVTPLFAGWISKEDNILFESGVLSDQSTLLELGCGTSGIIPMALAHKVDRFIATDQEYVFKILKQNLVNNPLAMTVSKKGKQRGLNRRNRTSASADSNIDVVALDWETSSVLSLPSVLPSGTSGVDMVIACDCIYNESLIVPFVETCTDICRLRKSSPEKILPTVCIVAQQLRSDIVFVAWLSEFLKTFRVWRIPDEVAGDGLKEGSGFVVHIGVLRN